MADKPLALLLKNLNRFLRDHSFRRKGQTFVRETEECWQTISVQRSRGSATLLGQATINLSVSPKIFQRFQNEPTDKPSHWASGPIYCRISVLLGSSDIWWPISNETEAEDASKAIQEILVAHAIKLFDDLSTNAGFLAFYNTGKIYGFEIYRDKCRLLLNADAGYRDITSTLAIDFAERWCTGPTSSHALEFLRKVQQAYPE
jgi:hypothetical protein